MSRIFMSRFFLTCIFMSRIFTTCIFDGAEISFLAFSVAPSRYVSRTNIRLIVWRLHGMSVCLQAIYDESFISLYNVLYTSLPVLALAVFDQVCCTAPPNTRHYHSAPFRLKSSTPNYIVVVIRLYWFSTSKPTYPRHWCCK